MSRAYDFTIVAVVTLVAVVMNRISLELLQPGSALYNVATTGTDALGGTEFANFVWQACAIWIPLLCVIGIMAWAMLREYRRQAVTATRAV